MQADEADQVPDGFIEERRVVIRHDAGRILQAHLQKRIRDSAVRLAVHKVSPAAHKLADDDAHARHVEQDGSRNFLALRNDEQRDRAADDAAVDGKSALPDVEDGNGIVGVELPIENAVIQPGADHADGYGPEDHVKHVVLRDAEVLRPREHIENSEQEPGGNDDAVPVDVLPKDRKGHGAWIDLDAEIWECDGRCEKHMNSS